MNELQKPTPEQRRRAWLTAAVLAATVVGIYAVFMFRVATLAGA